MIEPFNYEANTNLFAERKLGGLGGWQMFITDTVADAQKTTGLVVKSLMFAIK